MSVEWIHFPELEHLYKNVFTTSFPKKAFGIWGVPSFPKREHVRAVMYPPEVDFLKESR